MTITEALSLGVPVIATGYSGNLDFMDEWNTWRVPCSMTRVGESAGGYPKDALWAEPDLDAAARMMREIYENPTDAREKAAKARDHRRVGREMGIFYFDEAGPGFPFFLPKGMVMVNEIQSALRTELAAMGYDEIRTPTMLSDELWHQSGHYDNYADNMYFTEVDGQGFAVKPMNHASRKS